MLARLAALLSRRRSPVTAASLDAFTLVTLFKDLEQMQPLERGWITLSDCARLFVVEGSSLAPGKLDRKESAAIDAFAEEYGCTRRVIESEARIYFTKTESKATESRKDQSTH